MSRKNKTQFKRVYKEKNFTIVSNEIIKRADLSWKARAILIYVLSLPDDWNINLNEVMRHSTDGEASFRSGWKELTDAGYVKRKPVRDKENKKITHWETIIYESVDMTTSKPHSENLHVGNLDVENLHVGNRKLLSTKGTKNLNKQITNNTKDISPNSAKAKYGDDSPYLKLSKHLFNHIKKRNPNHRNPNFQNWADDFRKTVELDNRTIKEVKEIIDWSQQDDFWQNNILSAGKLRKQYDQLYLKMSESNIQNKERDYSAW